MKLGSFYLQMHKLVAELIPDIADDYRAQDSEASDETPAMTLTIGADAKGWSYQTGDNSYTGGAYGYHDWSVVTLYRDSDPHAIAEEIIEGLAPYDADAFNAIFPPVTIRNMQLVACREAIRGPYTSVGGYPVYIVMDDCGMLCHKCAKENYRTISRDTREGINSGWRFNCATVFYEGRETCGHCSAELESAYVDPDSLELRAPSSWASYLINGDASGLDDAEQDACDSWLSIVDCGGPVSCSDAGFCAHHDAWEQMPLAADCQTYVFDKRSKDLRFRQVQQG